MSSSAFALGPVHHVHLAIAPGGQAGVEILEPASPGRGSASPGR